MVIREYIIPIPLLPACLAFLIALSPVLEAKPRLMADEEMDQVCAKGSVGLSLDPVALNQMFIEFSRQTSLGLVSGTGKVTVDVIPSASGRTQIIMGPMITVGTPTTGGAPIAIPPTNIQVINGTVRISGDLNINMETLPSVVRALQQNRMVLPPGFNPLGVNIQGLGAIRP